MLFHHLFPTSTAITIRSVHFEAFAARFLLVLGNGNGNGNRQQAMFTPAKRKMKQKETVIIKNTQLTPACLWRR